MDNTSKKLDLGKLVALRKMRSRNGAEFIEDLVEVFETATQEGLTVMREAVQFKNAKGLVETAHYLKSSSATMGAHYMAALCLELENLGKHGEVDGKVYELIETLEKEFKSTLKELRQAGFE